MKRTVTTLAVAMILGASIGSSAMAQVPPNAGITGGEVARFDNGYLDEHPEVARQLAHDPRLVDNREYLENHPGLREYLHNHPVARRDWKSHPFRYMTAERHYDQKH